MVANDKVSVTLRDGFKFTGVVKSVEGVTVIVKFNEPEAEDRRNSAFDPEGCLAVHMSYVKALLACVLLAFALTGCGCGGTCAINRVGRAWEGAEVKKPVDGQK